jgi:hypothetical protein
VFCVLVLSIFVLKTEMKIEKGNGLINNADHLCSMNDGFYFVKKLKVDEFVPKYDIPNPSESLS